MFLYVSIPLTLYGSIAFLLDCSTTLLDFSIARLLYISQVSGHAITRQPYYAVALLLDYSIA